MLQLYKLMIATLNFMRFRSYKDAHNKSLDVSAKQRLCHQRRLLDLNLSVAVLRHVISTVRALRAALSTVIYINT